MAGQLESYKTESHKTDLKGQAHFGEQSYENLQLFKIRILFIYCAWNGLLGAVYDSQGFAQH